VAPANRCILELYLGLLLTTDAQQIETFPGPPLDLATNPV